MRGDNGFPVRMRYSKRGKVRFVGHRDVARGFERAFRIVGLPINVSRFAHLNSSRFSCGTSSNCAHWLRCKRQ